MNAFYEKHGLKKVSSAGLMQPSYLLKINVNLYILTVALVYMCSPGSMMLELEQRVCDLETWTEGKAVIVQGAAGTFCSGSDLNAVRAIANPHVRTPVIPL